MHHNIKEDPSTLKKSQHHSSVSLSIKILKPLSQVSDYSNFTFFKVKVVKVTQWMQNNPQTSYGTPTKP